MVQPKSTVAALAALALLAFLPGRPSAAEDDSHAQHLFAEAANYTVRVRVAVETPFIGDGRGASTGSGFVVDASRGWIVTNAHVAKRSPARVEIAFKDRPFVAARRHYVDPHLDVAVLAIEPGAMPETGRAAALGCTDPLPSGRNVGAFGHPWGLNFTATRGILSGVRFRFGFEFIQTDAALNPGNSGGPLIDLTSGRVLGVNAMTMSRTTSEGINFAVPIQHVCRLLELLREGRDASPPEFPLILATDADSEDKLIVARPMPGAWSELFKPGDRIVSVAGDREASNLTRVLTRLRGAGESTNVEIDRRGEKLSIEVPLRRQALVTDRVGVRFSGMIIAPYFEPDAFELDPDGLLVIHSVDGASEAGINGVVPGDVIYSIEGKQFRDPGDLFRWLETQPRGGRLELMLRRNSRARHLFYEYHVKSLRLDAPRLVR